MAKKKKNNIDPIIYIIIGVVVFVLIAVLVRMNTHIESTLTCTKNLTGEYKETLTFKFNADNDLYSYNREELLHDMSDEGLEANVKYFNEQLDQLKDSLSDNFKYTVEKDNKELHVKTFINVKVYPVFFNQYLNNEHINSQAKINDVDKYLRENDYKCYITKR